MDRFSKYASAWLAEFVIAAFAAAGILIWVVS